ncbi:MAG: hypothetical protein ACREO3_07710 [Arenimonas sp.]
MSWSGALRVANWEARTFGSRRYVAVDAADPKRIAGGGLSCVHGDSPIHDARTLPGFVPSSFKAPASARALGREVFGRCRVRELRSWLRQMRRELAS